MLGCRISNLLTTTITVSQAITSSISLSIVWIRDHHFAGDRDIENRFPLLTSEGAMNQFDRRCVMCKGSFLYRRKPGRHFWHHPPLLAAISFIAFTNLFAPVPIFLDPAMSYFSFGSCIAEVLTTYNRGERKHSLSISHGLNRPWLAIAMHSFPFINVPAQNNSPLKLALKICSQVSSSRQKSPALHVPSSVVPVFSTSQPILLSQHVQAKKRSSCSHTTHV